MRRAYAVQRQIQEETIDVGVIDNAITQDDGNVAIQALCGSTLLHRNVRQRGQGTIVHWLATPSMSPRVKASSHALRRSQAAASYVGSAAAGLWTPLSGACIIAHDSVQTVQITL